MPGILPMKVIKVGTNSQSRIAQACDRCRSKKIRCDGFRPTCSQCSNVGFECKTSDKLSRRAFPRGYTESLEERVRTLESESRELKDSLDERDEKIDMLSRIQSQYNARQASTPRRASSVSSSGARVDIISSLQQEKEDVFKVQQSPFLHVEDANEPYFVGTSSGRSFVDAFKRKVQESGTPCAALDTDIFFPAVHPNVGSIPTSPGRIASWIAPPRLLSDQMVNVFFQEWAPLFPVLHRPTFLALYDKYMSNTCTVDDMESLAQLNLVFGIAALSNSSRIPHDTERCEAQWQAALHTFMFETSITTLQCLVLAQIYCIQKGDFAKLLHYRSLAVGMAQRLGLHQSQKRFALGALTSETRKKVFWTLYTLDCFSAAAIGLPRLMKDEDIHCEYPVDADDEYVTEQGFQPTLPGEATKLSAALALFRACRTMAKTLEEIYPASSSHEISFRSITTLNGELDDWYENLPPHLRLTFVQEKPSTNVISSRCPLLCLTYHYIRMLIHRPVVCASIGERSSNSIMAVASSSKSLVQIIRLLDERNFSFSFCINRNELLTLSGFGLLFQALDLDKDGKMIQDSQRLVCSVIDLLDRGSAPGASEFRSIGCDMISIGNRMKHDATIPIRPVEMSPPQSLTGAQLTLASARYATHKLTRKEQNQPTSNRRSTHPAPATNPRRKGDSSKSNSSKPSAISLSSVPSDASSSHHNRSYSNSSISNSSSRAKLAGSPNEPPNTNLDFFSFPDDPSPPNKQKPPRPSGTEWEQLLATIDNTQTIMFDNAYSLSGNDGLVSPHSAPDASPEAIIKGPFVNTPDDSLLHSDWSPSNMWSISGESLDEGTRNAPQSVLSFSDDSLTSGEDFSSMGDVASSRSNSAFRGIVMPHYGAADGDSLDFEELTL